MQIIRKVPAQHHIEMRRGIYQVIDQKLPAVEHYTSLLVFGHKRGFGRGDQQIFAVYSVAAFGEVTDIRRRR